MSNGIKIDLSSASNLTHPRVRIVRGILLKGNGLGEILPNLWPIVLFLILVLSIGLKRYRQTLD